MKGYINSIIIISICSSLLCSLISNSSVKKYVTYISRLILVIILLSPLSGVIKNVSNIKSNISSFMDGIYSDTYENKTNQIIINSTSEKVSSKIKEQVMEKFSFDESDVYVSLDLESENKENIKIRKINITLTNKASWSDKDRVEEYVKNLIGCDVSVTKK